MIVGLLDKRMALYKCRRGDVNPIGAALVPPVVSVQIQNQGLSEARTLTHLVTMRYHPQVTIDTVGVYNSRNFFVLSVQNVNEDNEEMQLICEEIAT